MAIDDGQRAVALFWLTRRLYRRRHRRYNMYYVCVLHYSLTCTYVQTKSLIVRFDPIFFFF